MIRLRIHYLTDGKTRCGNPSKNVTIHSDYVTCASCKRFMNKELQS